MPRFSNRPPRRGLLLLAVLCVFAGRVGAQQPPPVVACCAWSVTATDSTGALRALRDWRQMASS